MQHMECSELLPLRGSTSQSCHFEIVHTWGKGRCHCWRVRFIPNDVRQWDVSMSNLPVQKVLKGFRPFDNRQCLRYLGSFRGVFSFLLFQGGPLNIKVLHHSVPLEVGCCKVMANCPVVVHQITHNSNSSLGLGTKNEWWEQLIQVELWG